MKFRRVVPEPYTWPIPAAGPPVVKVVVIGMSPRRRLPAEGGLGPHVIIAKVHNFYREDIKLPVDGDLYVMRAAQTSPRNVAALAEVVPARKIYVASGLLKDLAVKISRVLKRKGRRSRG